MITMATHAGDTSAEPKQVRWIGSSRDDIQKLPEGVQRTFGFALFQAQIGSKHRNAKPLIGFGGASVLEVVEDELGSTYRAVYTVRFAELIYALHVFQKKSKTGSKTPREVIQTIVS